MIAKWKKRTKWLLEHRMETEWCTDDEKVKQTNANKKWEILNDEKKTEKEHTWNKALEVVASKTS
jgi:hypothetical protein